MKLSRIRLLGRYKKPDGSCVNVYKGHRATRGTDQLFFYRRGRRIVIEDAQFHKEWRRVDYAV